MEERILRPRVLVVKGMASGCLDGQGVLPRTRRSSRVLAMQGQVVPATSAWWAQRTAPLPVRSKTAGRGGLIVDLGWRALSSTCSRDALPIKLHQPAINIPYEGLMGSDDRRKAGGQLELPVERYVVAPVGLLQRAYGLPENLEWDFGLDHRIVAVNIRLK